MENNKQKIIILGLFNLGIVSLLIQILLIRELVTSFYGNEMYIGLVLAFWLLSVGLGSLFLPKFFLKKIDSSLFFLHILIPVFLILALFLARIARVVLSRSGVVPDFFLASLWSLMVILPVGLFLGMMFVFLAKKIKLKNSQAVTTAYVIESFGFFIGAIIFSFLLYKYSSLAIIFLISIFLFLLSLSMSFKFSLKKSIIIFLLTVLTASGLYWAGGIDKKMSGWNFSGQNLIDSINSKYGSIQITKTKEQINFYYNGKIIDNSQNTFHNELLANAPMLLADNTKNVLVIGNGLTGLVEEVGNHKPEKIIYLELDRDYLKAVRDEIDFKPLPILEIQNKDARSYLNNTLETFDVIIINYANPSTLSENRYFTKEFFALIKSRLNKFGILAFQMDTTPNYSFGAQNKLLLTVFHTLKKSFPFVLALPDNEVVFLAGSQPFIYESEKVKKKFEGKGLDNKYIIFEYLDWRFTSTQTVKLNEDFKNNQAEINSDFKPILYYQQLKIFLEKMKIGKNWEKISMVLAVLMLLMIVLLLKNKSYDRRLLVASAIPEFCLLSFEMLLIILFQTFHGYLYSQLSFIIALILAGISTGSIIFSRLLKKYELKFLLKLSYLIIIFMFFFTLIFVWQFSYLFNYKVIYFVLSILSGLAIGTKFPLINRLYLKTSPNLGAVYGADLIGAGAGAVLAGTFMLPILGVAGSLGAIVGLCIISFILIKIK